MLREPSQVDKAVERMRTLTRPVGITGQRDWDVAVVDGSRIVLTPTASGQRAAVDNAMQQAVEVIRRRIDEMGTREPQTISKGRTRMVQIGRGSCREREGKCEGFGVVAVIIKNKKT